MFSHFSPETQHSFMECSSPCVDGLLICWCLCTVDNTIRLQGAGAFAFHPTLEWIFVGDRRGTILAWDVSTERPIMIGM